MLPANAGTFGVTDQLFEEAVQFTPTDFGIGTINASFGNMTDSGPNPVFSSVTFIGWQMNGLPGAVLATIAVFALSGCQKAQDQSQAADSTARNLTLAPSESTAQMHDVAPNPPVA